MRNFLLYSLAATTILSSCKKAPDYDPQINDLKDKIKKIEESSRWDDMMKESEGTAFLKPTDKSYSMVRADFGDVAISIQDVSDYANGVKLQLRVGNTTTASVSGLKAKIEWGQVDGNGVAKGEVFSKSETFVDDLPAASWHNYEVILSGISAKELGYVRVSALQNTSISLLMR